MTTPVPITDLNDQDAITLLAHVIDHNTGLPDPAHQNTLQEQLRAAANAQPHTTPDRQITAGELARQTLTYLASTPDGATTITRAAALNTTTGTRLDPATLAIGALILLALQTELDIQRDTHGKWQIHIHKKAANDTTLTTLTAKIITYFQTRGQ